MSDQSVNDNPLDALAEEFVARFRRGERPALAEYTSRHPELADEIRELFPALVMMEEVRPGHADPVTPADLSGPRSATGVRLERLGDYRILREVGRGGMGIVYEAEQESLGRHVALKVLPAHTTLDPRHLQRFQREARAAAGLHHTNIIPVFGVGAQDGLNYFVMQFIQGLSLDEVLVELKRLRKTKSETLAATERGNEVKSPLRESPGGPSGQQTTDSLSANRKVTSDRSAVEMAEALLTGEFRCATDENGVPHQAASVERPELGVATTTPQTLQAQAATSGRTRFSTADSSGVWLPGQPGNTTLSDTGRAYWLSVARIGVQVADALAYANSQGVIHRDIKPSNLLLDTHGTVWVADFGLAKAEDSDDLTRTGDIVGTLRYLAPERLQGESDARSDIYSLGTTLYELLTLRPAFEEWDRNQLIQKVAQAEPPAPRSINAAIPRDLETIVLKAIAKSPSDRYGSADALAADLRRFLEDKPIRARRMGPGERLWRSCRRNPAVAGLTIAVGVLLVSAVVILSISNARIRRETGEKEIALRTARDNERRAKANEELAERTAAEREEQRRIAVDNETLARRRFYAAQMNLASQAVKRDQLARALDLLETQRPEPGEPDLRGFEWSYLWREIHRALHVSFRHDDEVWCLAFSPDGSTLAVGGKSGNRGILKLWDVATGELQAALEDSDYIVHGVGFSPDGKFLASGSADAKIRIWDVAARRVTNRIDAGDGVRSLRWSREGGLIAAGCQDGSVRIYDAANFELKASLSPMGAPVLGLAFSRDGKRLVSAAAWGGPKEFSRIHDLTTFPPQLLHELKGRFVTDASPDGQMVASYESGFLHVWDPATKTDRAGVETNAGWLNSVRFSPDASRIVTAGFDDRMATVWDSVTLKPLVRGPHAQAVQVVAFDPNQRFWASASIDGEVKVWHYDVPRETTVIEHDDKHYRTIYTLADGSLILGGESAAQGRDVETGDPRDVPPVRHLRAISADGSVMVSVVPEDDEHAPETIQIWERATGKMRQSFRLPDKTPLYYRSIAISSSGRLLATRSWECPLRVWDVSGTEPRQLHEFAPVMSISLAFSPDERLLVAGCQFGRVSQWNLETGNALPDLQGYESGSGWAFSVSFSPDGSRLAAGNSFGVVRVWDVPTMRLVATLKGHLGEIPDVVFFPDGRRLAVASVGAIQLWDAQVGQELISLDAPSEIIRSLAVTPDGRNLISQHDHGTIRIWKSRSRGPAR